MAKGARALCVPIARGVFTKIALKSAKIGLSFPELVIDALRFSIRLPVDRLPPHPLAIRAQDVNLLLPPSLLKRLEYVAETSGEPLFSLINRLLAASSGLGSATPRYRVARLRRLAEENEWVPPANYRPARSFSHQG